MVWDYVHENGRRYDSLSAAKYVVLNDEVTKCNTLLSEAGFRANRKDST